MKAAAQQQPMETIDLYIVRLDEALNILIDAQPMKWSNSSKHAEFAGIDSATDKSYERYVIRGWLLPKLDLGHHTLIRFELERLDADNKFEPKELGTFKEYLAFLRKHGSNRPYRGRNPGPVVMFGASAIPDRLPMVANQEVRFGNSSGVSRHAQQGQVGGGHDGGGRKGGGERGDQLRKSDNRNRFRRGRKGGKNVRRNNNNNNNSNVNNSNNNSNNYGPNQQNNRRINHAGNQDNKVRLQANFADLAQQPEPLFEEVAQDFEFYQ